MNTTRRLFFPRRVDDMCTHIPTLTYTHTSHTSYIICLHTQMHTEEAKDKRRKMEDGSVRVNRKKQAHALTSILLTFVPSLLCSKLGHQFMTLKRQVYTRPTTPPLTLTTTTTIIKTIITTMTIIIIIRAIIIPTILCSSLVACNL